MNLIKSKRLWIFSVVSVLLVYTYLFAIQGYSSGYGQVIDDEVVFNRTPLVNSITQDYTRDGGEWSFGYIVPFAVVGLFWYRRKELMLAEVRPSLITGGGILLLGFFMYWIGFRGEQKYFGYASGQILALGCILWFLGWAWFRNVFWLWVLLGMMWPWRFMIERISAPLQMIMVKFTTGFLKLFDIGAVANGSSILTDTKDPVTGNFINMDVDVACSGMRSLFALLMIGIIFTFISLRKEWKRWILVVCVPAVAIAANFVRLLMLYTGSRFWGTEFAIGEELDMSGYHLISGLVVFVVALMLLTLISSALDGHFKFFNRKKVTSRKVD